MKLARVIFTESVEAPGGLNRVAYLQSTDAKRADSYRDDLWLGPQGVMAGDEIYPLSMVRRITVAREEAEVADLPAPITSPTGVDPATVEQPKRRGRPPKQKT
jgi:hypothetical protein